MTETQKRKPRAKKTPAPWDKANPKKKSGAKTKHLTTAEENEAKARAKEAGRPYPNLVDNMAVAKKAKTTRAKKSDSKPATAKKSADTKTTARKTTSAKTNAKKTTSRKRAAKKD